MDGDTFENASHMEADVFFILDTKVALSKISVYTWTRPYKIPFYVES